MLVLKSLALDKSDLLTENIDNSRSRVGFYYMLISLVKSALVLFTDECN